MNFLARLAETDGDSGTACSNHEDDRGRQVNLVNPTWLGLKLVEVVGEPRLAGSSLIHIAGPGAAADRPRDTPLLVPPPFLPREPGTRVPGRLCLIR
jgi:hypothetical protein